MVFEQFFQNTLMARDTPPPFMGNAILNFHFFNTSLCIYPCNRLFVLIISIITERRVQQCARALMSLQSFNDEPIWKASALHLKDLSARAKRTIIFVPIICIITTEGRVQQCTRGLMSLNCLDNLSMISRSLTCYKCASFHNVWLKGISFAFAKRHIRARTQIMRI